MMVHQFGKSFRIGFIPNVQRCGPIELACGRSSTGLHHFGDAKIDAVGKYGCKQQNLISRRLSGLQVGEVLAEPRPAIDLQEQIGDLDVRDQSVGAAHQYARFFRHRVTSRRYLQPALADRSIGQFAMCSQAVHLIDGLFE